MKLGIATPTAHGPGHHDGSLGGLSAVVASTLGSLARSFEATHEYNHLLASGRPASEAAREVYARFFASRQ